jgi:8-hydroxy-5-deazaflavin:NADPH oxidoreductase
MRIAVIGGTGKEGRGLAVRWAKAGHDVRIGSRDAERARERAAELATLSGGRVAGGANSEVASDCEVAVLTVPYAAHAATLQELRPALAGKILIDITVPLKPPKVQRVELPPGRAAALEAQELLGPETRVVASLQHVSSVHLADPGHAIECDVLACSDDPAALEVALGLIEDLGLRGLDAGPLVNAIALESLTPVLLHMNKRYKSPGSGVRFTGL